MRLTNLIWTAVITTVMVLVVLFVANRFAVTKNLVQAALLG